MVAVEVKPILLFSLLPVMVLVGLFQYLGRFTRRPHFRTWTIGWLFYGLFLALHAVPIGAVGSELVAILKNWSIATGALLMLWGSFQFINIPGRQRLVGMMMVFNLMWSCATSEQYGHGAWLYFPAFVFLAVASGFTAFCIFSRRTAYARRGAALLTLAFTLWALFLLCSPFLAGSGKILYTGLMAASVLQLFIAVSMMVLVLEETRGRLQLTVDNLARESQQAAEFQHDAEAARLSYRALFESSRDAVAIVAEDDLEILELNSAARKLLLVKDDPTGLSLTRFCSLPNQRSSDAALLAGALPRSPEVELTLADGARVRARVRSQSVLFGGRRALQVILCDVAERSNMARQLRGGGKLNALGQVISGVAHELNNPLAAIKGYTDLLLLTSQVDPQTRAALTKVSMESNRAARLVQDLLAFARPETPKIEPLRLNELIERHVTQRKEEISAKGLSLELALDAGARPVLASGDQLQQVLAHLLNNAIEAIEETDAAGAIRISTKAADGKVYLRVEDNGPGIDADVLPRIFEPFFTTKPVGTGTGLGLSLCYSIVLHHKGRISCQPSELGGACFVVELPALSGALEPVSKIATPDFRPRCQTGASKRQARLLVVDDEPTVVALLNDMLSLLGHQVSFHTSPHEALAALEQGDFDAVLSDFRMPGMTGGELFERAVRLNQKYRDRFLFLTGDMLDPETNEFFAAQRVPCILKPFQLAALQAGLGEILARVDAEVKQMVG